MIDPRNILSGEMALEACVIGEDEILNGRDDHDDTYIHFGEHTPPIVAIEGKRYIEIRGSLHNDVWRINDHCIRDGLLVRCPDDWEMEDIRQSEIAYRPIS